jgi:hypothetical protein
MDDMILRACVRGLNNEKNRKYLRGLIERNYGFEYKKHFKSLLLSLVGLRGYESLIKHIDPVIVAKFQVELGNLKKRRNSMAHTYYKGTTANYDAPSITMGRFQNIQAGLKAYDATLREHC